MLICHVANLHFDLILEKKKLTTLIPIYLFISKIKPNMDSFLVLVLQNVKNMSQSGRKKKWVVELFI